MITFFGMPSRSSGEVRGRQLAKRIPGAVFLDVHNPDQSKLHANKIVLFVRAYNEGLAVSLKQAGHTVGYDVADMMVSDAAFRGLYDEDVRRHVHSECDFYVVNNGYHAAKLRALDNAAFDVFTIPHHSPNFAGVKNEFRDPVRRVGYVGLPEQLSARDSVEAVCRKHGAEFVSEHPTTREACDALLRTLDVGVAFVEADGRVRPEVAELTRKYKPNTKAVNFAAYGVSAVCARYLSYEEFVDGGCVFADTSEQMLLELDALLRDTDKRRALADAAFEIGKNFHVDVVAAQYMAMAKAVAAIKERNL